MKFYYRLGKPMLLTALFLVCYQLGFSQNIPIQPAQPFQPELLVKGENGTFDYKGVIIGPYIAEMLTQDEPHTDEITAVFTFDDAEIARELRPKLVQKGGEFVGPDFDILPFQGINAHLPEVLAMAEMEGVQAIWHNRKMDQTMHQAIITSSVKDAWEDMDFTDLNDGLQLSGRGVGVLVNDSGFDGELTDLETTDQGELHKRIVEQVRGNGSEADYNWVESAEADTDQGNGHGSHCMGIVGGDGRYSNGKYVGVAPGTDLIGYGSGLVVFVLDGLGGFEYTLKHRKDYNIRIISNSFGSTSDTMFMGYNHNASPYNTATKACVDNGVVVVFAAGNGGPTDGKIGGNFIAAPWVIAVANGTKDGALAGSSSPGRPDPVHGAQREETVVDGTRYLWENRPAVTAPGTDIIAVRSTGSALAPLSVADDATLDPTELPFYTFLTGTSMACPHIAGVIALMIEANHEIEWRSAKGVLQRTAIDAMTEQFHQRGAGYVNAHAAVAAAFHGLCDTDNYTHPDADATEFDKMYGLRSDGSFGFDDDPWKTCPLHPEVASRLKEEIPVPGGVELGCEPGQAQIEDETGANDAPQPYFDIEEVQFFEETADDFKVSMKVAGQLAASPAGSPGQGAQHFYDVHFTMNKPSEANSGEPEITYILRAFDEAAVNKRFVLTVRTADGTTRPNTAMSEELTGEWNTGTNTITWTVPKASLNVSGTPLTSTDMPPRDSRASRAGDILKRWAAFTYDRPALITPDGAGIYNDTASGNCFETLEVVTPAE